MMRIKHCSTASDYAFARQITRDYMNWLNVDLTFQNVEKEFSEFTTMYGPPDGAYLLAFEDDELAGGVGLRKLQAKVCEMKRLYVYDASEEKGSAGPFVKSSSGMRRRSVTPVCDWIQLIVWRMRFDCTKTWGSLT
jgi:hypothetical protein